MFLESVFFFNITNINKIRKNYANVTTFKNMVFIKKHKFFSYYKITPIKKLLFRPLVRQCKCAPLFVTAHFF